MATKNVTSTPENIDVEQDEERDRMEDEVRRQEVKRKTFPGGRKPKRRKLEKLVGLGEPQTKSNNMEISSEVGLGLGVGNTHVNIYGLLFGKYKWGWQFRAEHWLRLD
jgi:hypothetical protein